MGDALDRLAAALADRYRIDVGASHASPLLGAGGMATVYLAEDLKHHRKVAVKVLRAEIAATLGAERFSREIEVAAQLQHPHILPLLDSGEAAGFFYYVMPFVDGESLRERLTRQGELPVHEAVKILREVVDALAAAHARGVVHRDIKPDNIMLSGRHALVMDFGVAKAVSEATGRNSLTSVGVALGTPAYMAPEQAAADPHLDHRVDIYAVGALGYELLTGRPPFTGRTPQEVLAAHITQAPDPVDRHRQGLSPALTQILMKCLAKRPADRWQTAEELLQQLEPLATTSGGTTPAQTTPVRAMPLAARRGWLAGAGTVALVLVTLVLWRPWNRSGAGHALDRKLVAVLPFRVAGADPSLQYLRQGMVDLLQAKLTGEGGPRAADARSVLAAVRDAGGSETADIAHDALLTVARKLGAGLVLEGSIVGPSEHVVISAALLEMPGARTVAQTSVEGGKDSLFSMVDRLTAQLLALGAGASTSQLSALTTTSLEALRAYLDGQAAMRRGAFDRATPLLTHAVQLDSTFALALSALVESNGWHNATIDMSRVERLAWQGRSRLNARDQLLLSIRLGSRYPRETPWTERIADRERATQVMPESPEAWYSLGDGLFHFGTLADIPDAVTRARQAFEQAVQRDSLFGGPISHLARVAFVTGDTTAQLRWTRRLLTLDSTSSNARVARWDQMFGTRDLSGLRAALAGADSLSAGLSAGIVFRTPLDSVVIAHQAELLAAAQGRATTRSDRQFVAFVQAITLWNRGRPAEADRWLDSLRVANTGWGAWLSVSGALISGGNPPDTSRLRGNNPSGLDLWMLSRGDLAAGVRLVAESRAEATRDTLTGGPPRFAALAQAMMAVQRGIPTAGRMVDVADSLWRGYKDDAETTSMLLARLYERLGRLDRALSVVRRRERPLGQPNPLGLAESLRLEGRLAAATGDRAGAIRAYRDYLRLRSDPEPSRIPQRDSVRAELAALGDLEGTR